MISKPFNKPEPSGSRLNAGWCAEKQLAFYLERQYGTATDIFVFNDLRFEDITGGFSQIDHLILYRHGIAIIESKSTSGELHVDRLGQWRRKWRSRSGRGGDENMPDPLAQAERQATSLRNLLSNAQPPLMNKLLGLAQKKFREFPIMPFVAISDNGRFTGDTRPYADKVMKADQITGVINEQIAHHRRNSGIRGLIFSKEEDVTIFNLADDELSRIRQFLTEKHTPSAASQPAHPAPPQSPRAATPVAPPSPAQPAAAPASPAGAGRVERLEPLSCAKCRSINVQVIYARDYCLKCAECGKFSPLAYTCPLCGKHATIRKDGPVYYRDCDHADGCRKQTVFARAD